MGFLDINRYVDNDEGIKKYFAAFHLHHTFPATVIIDDFGDFFEDRLCSFVPTVLGVFLYNDLRFINNLLL